MSDEPPLGRDSLKFYIVKEGEMPDDGFGSSVEEFTDYYHTDSLQDIRERLVRMYVAKHSNRVVGYVTLAMAHLRHDATDEIRAKEINGSIPALLISHLAVHKNFHRRGIGTQLLNLVFHIVPKLECWAGCRYVMLNPRDDKGVRGFYSNYGLTYYPDINDDKERDAFLMDLKKMS